MFDLVSSWLLAIWPYAPETQLLSAANLSPWVQQTTAADLIAPRYAPDHTTVSALNAHIQTLESQGLLIDQQGVWFQSGRHILAQHEGTTPLPAASLTKIATTLAALDTWGVDHSFETLVYYRGTVEDGVLQGDLMVQGGGDPFFVWEEAIALGNALNAAGIQSVTGDLIITGSFAMNFKEDPEVSALLLQRGMNADLWPDEAQQQFAEMATNTPRPSVAIQGRVQVISPSASLARGVSDDVGAIFPPPQNLSDNVTAVGNTLGDLLTSNGILLNRGADGITVQETSPPPPSSVVSSLPVGSDDFRPLIRHRSVPLIDLLRQMNIYSNNFMADALARHLGGADAIVDRITQLTGTPDVEIQIVNGSGLGVENRISARAACAMLMAIDGQLKRSGYSVADVLPVAGIDAGTIQNRDLPPEAAVKTGTLATVSTLAGSMPRDDGGVTWFAILHWGSDLDSLRDEQDVLLRTIVKPAGMAASESGSRLSSEANSSGDEMRGAIAHSTDPTHRAIHLGAPSRNDILMHF